MIKIGDFVVLAKSLFQDPTNIRALFDEQAIKTTTLLTAIVETITTKIVRPVAEIRSQPGFMGSYRGIEGMEENGYDR